ncbi:MAG: hypothetical protein FWE04_05690 [Oscillospiraceae bacterium]|nr:hypothetical protein [Oscillospiraceae bacterium]
MKKLFALVLVLAMMVTMLPIVATGGAVGAPAGGGLSILVEADFNFGTMEFGEAPPPARPIRITNTGNAPIMAGAMFYWIHWLDVINATPPNTPHRGNLGRFNMWETIQPGQFRVWYVRPQAGLPAGTYKSWGWAEAIQSLSGGAFAQESIEVSLTVTGPDFSDIDRSYVVADSLVGIDFLATTSWSFQDGFWVPVPEPNTLMGSLSNHNAVIDGRASGPIVNQGDRDRHRTFFMAFDANEIRNNISNIGEITLGLHSTGDQGANRQHSWFNVYMLTPELAASINRDDIPTYGAAYDLGLVHYRQNLVWSRPTALLHSTRVESPDILPQILQYLALNPNAETIGFKVRGTNQTAAFHNHLNTNVDMNATPLAPHLRIVEGVGGPLPTPCPWCGGFDDCDPAICEDCGRQICDCRCAPPCLIPGGVIMTSNVVGIDWANARENTPSTHLAVFDGRIQHGGGAGHINLPHLPNRHRLFFMNFDISDVDVDTLDEVRLNLAVNHAAYNDPSRFNMYMLPYHLAERINHADIPNYGAAYNLGLISYRQNMVWSYAMNLTTSRGSRIESVDLLPAIQQFLEENPEATTIGFKVWGIQGAGVFQNATNTGVDDNGVPFAPHLRLVIGDGGGDEPCPWCGNEEGCPMEFCRDCGRGVCDCQCEPYAPIGSIIFTYPSGNNGFPEFINPQIGNTTNLGINFVINDVDFDRVAVQWMRNGEPFGDMTDVAMNGRNGSPRLTLVDVHPDLHDGGWSMAVYVFDANTDAVVLRDVSRTATLTVRDLVRGDVTGDGSISMEGLLMLGMYLTGQGVEINPDGAMVTAESIDEQRVRTADLVMLARFLAGHDVILGEGE